VGLSRVLGCSGKDARKCGGNSGTQGFIANIREWQLAPLLSVQEIAHVGHNRDLMKTRSLVLRAAGFSVEEAYSFATALTLGEVVDVLLICHRWPGPDKKRLVSGVRNNRTPIPIIVFRSGSKLRWRILTLDLRPRSIILLSIATGLATRPLNVLQVRRIRGWLLKPCGDSSKERLPLVILNVSRDPLLREARAKTLHDAGYYTSAAQTPEEAIELAAQLRCAIAIVCHSFTVSERRWIHTRLQEDAPTMTVVFLGESADGNPKVLLSAVKSAVASRDTCNAVVWRLSFRP
jgi:DNA-binding response OmpR family regulator